MHFFHIRLAAFDGNLIASAMVGLSRVYQAMSTFFCLLGLIGSLVGFTLVIIHLKTRSQLIDSVSFLLKVGQAGRFDLVLIGYQQIIFACSLALCLLIHFVNYVGSTMLKPTVTALNGNLILVGILIVFGLGGSVLSGALFPSRLNVCMTKGMKFGVARHFGFFLSLTRPESLNKSLPVSSTKPWEDTANLHRLQSVYRCCGDRGWRSYRYRQHYTFDQ